MSHLQAGPLGLHDDNSDGIIGTTLLLHAGTGTQRLKTTSWSPAPPPTPSHTNTHTCKWVYVRICLQGRGGLRGWMSPVTGVEWWHFCGISCLSLNICDMRLALEGMFMCVCVCVCVCVCGKEGESDWSGEAPQTNEQVIKALSPFPPPLLTCQPTRLWDTLGDTVPAHSNNKPCPCLPSSSSHLGLLITALNFLLLTRSHPCPPQTNNLGGRILIIIASEKSDCLLLKLPTGHAGFSPSPSLSLPSLSLSHSPLLSLVRDSDGSLGGNRYAGALAVGRRVDEGGDSHACWGFKLTQTRCEVQACARTHMHACWAPTMSCGPRVVQPQSGVAVLRFASREHCGSLKNHKVQLPSPVRLHPKQDSALKKSTQVKKIYIYEKEVK